NSWQFENYLTYNKQFADIHSINALLGISWQHVDYFGATARAQRFQDDYFQYNNLGAGANPVAASSGTSAYGLNSYFGRINYNLIKKNLVTLTGRFDDSSKCSETYRYAVLPSSVLASILSEQELLKFHLSSYYLKLRTYYGVTGNSKFTACRSLAGWRNCS